MMGPRPSADLGRGGGRVSQLTGLGMGVFFVVLAESVSWRNIISRPYKTRSGEGLLNQALLPPPPPQ